MHTNRAIEIAVETLERIEKALAANTSEHTTDEDYRARVANAVQIYCALITQPVE